MKALTYTREMLEVVLDHVADGITVQSLSGVLLYVNAAAARIMGYSSADEVLSTPVDQIMNKFTLFDEAGNEISSADLPGRRAIMGQDEPEMIIRFYIKNKKHSRWSRVKATPIYAPNGQISTVVNVFHDITEIKERELDLREANSRIVNILEGVITKTE